jgi:hypothetical protein
MEIKQISIIWKYLVPKDISKLMEILGAKGKPY